MAWDLFPGAVDSRFGVVDAWRLPQDATDLRIGWERLTFQWSSLQPKSSQDWNSYAVGFDQVSKTEVQAGRSLVGMLLETPSWAALAPSLGRSSPPKGLDLAWNDPNNFWGNFVYQIAKRYAGRINDWVVWNEVDIPSPATFNTWSGTVAQYAQMVRVAYQAARAANPNSRIALYGEPYWYDEGKYLQAVLDTLASFPDAKAHNDFFDIAVLHLYARPIDMDTVVTWYRRELTQHGLNKPIWINETNVVPRDDPLRTYPKANFNGTLSDQASFIIQAVAIDLADNVQRVAVNRMQDGPDFDAGGEPLGLVRNDGSLRPAYYAYKTVTHLFAGVTSGKYLPNYPSKGTYEVLLNRPDMQITVAWDQSPVRVSVTLLARSSTACLVDKLGHVRTVRTAEKGFVVSLPGATDNSNPADPHDYVVGGDPVILVQPTSSKSKVCR
jgi:hypothetical protein